MEGTGIGFMSNKWIATALSIWIQCVSGASYTFSIYSAALKSTQGYDQSTLDTVSVFKDIGANAGVVSGFLYTAVTPATPRRSSPARFLSGPWIVHAGGAIQWFVGYIFIWAAVSGVIDRPPVPAMCFFMFLAAHAQTFFNTANVVTGVHNFAHYSGTIVGIMKVLTQTLVLLIMNLKFKKYMPIVGALDFISNSPSFRNPCFSF